jgi:hypothetical protein
MLLKLNFVCYYLSVVLTVGGVLLSFIKLQKNPQDKRWSAYLVACLITFLCSALYGQVVLGLLMKINLGRLDSYAFAFDRILGQPSFVVGRLLHKLPWLNLAVRFAYMFIYPSMVITFSWFFLTQTYEEAIGVLKAMMLAPLGVLVYLVIPVAGPAYLFPGFPFDMEHRASMQFVAAHAPNGVPSGHFTMALMLAYFWRRWWLSRILSTVNLILMFCATLGTGEHYAFDLLAALPFAAFLLYVSDEAFTLKWNAWFARLSPSRRQETSNDRVSAV